MGGQRRLEAGFEGSYLERQFQAGVRFTFQTRRSPVAPEGVAGDNSCAILGANVSSRCSHPFFAARGAHWAQIRLQQDGGNRDSLGAWIGVERAKQPTLWGRIRTDGSYLTAQDPTLQFGLGQWRGPVTVRVEWPAGASERFAVANVGQRVTLTRGTGTRVSSP